MKKNNVKSLIGNGVKMITVVYSEEATKRNINKVKLLKALKRLGDGDYGFATQTIKELNDYCLNNQKYAVKGIYKIDNSKIVITAVIFDKKIDCYHISTLNEHLDYIKKEIEKETNEELIKLTKLEYMKLSKL